MVFWFHVDPDKSVRLVSLISLENIKLISEYFDISVLVCTSLKFYVKKLPSSF